MADSKALENLYQGVQDDADLSCHVCFMAHEVAEKSLKGAMYAKCGLRDKQRQNHNIIPLGRAIEQVEQEKARGLSDLTCPLEPTYYEGTRFPKKNAATFVPFEEFSPAKAEEAKRCADGILKIVRNIVNI